MKKNRDLNTAKPMPIWGRTLLFLACALLLLFPRTGYVDQAAAGDLDITFGTGGKVRTDFFGGEDVANAIAIQADGKIVMAGRVSGDFALARYNPNGSLDPTFGIGGKVLTDILMTTSAECRDIAIQPDGKIVAVGSIGFRSFQAMFVVVRYHPNGSLDPTFGSGGIVTTTVLTSDEAWSVALQPDGKIIAGGTDLDYEGVGVERYALARYNADGSLDPTFGSGGRVVVGGAGGIIEDLALQTDGKIVAIGGFGAFVVKRFNANGSLDSNFGAGGQAISLFGVDRVATGVAIQPDQKILVGGGVATSASTGGFAVARYNTNGSLDTSFGAGGVAISEGPRVDDLIGGAGAIALQSDGKIVLAGSVGRKLAVMRNNQTGEIDTTFNTVLVEFECTDTPFGHPFSSANSVAIQQDGKIVAGGTSCIVVPGRDFILVRFNGDSPAPGPNPTFNLCVQDDSSGDILQINSVTGDYQFIKCGNGVALSGTGTLITKGSTVTLQHFASDRRVLAKIDGGVNKATATVQTLSPSATFTLADRNMGNNTCSCP